MQEEVVVVMIFQKEVELEIMVKEELHLDLQLILVKMQLLLVQEEVVQVLLFKVIKVVMVLQEYYIYIFNIHKYLK
jgi:hypothetical protein